MPPGQYVTDDFPVLSAGPTPHTPLAEWDLSIAAVETDAAYVTAFCDGGYTTNLPLEDVAEGKAWIAYAYDGAPLSPSTAARRGSSFRTFISGRARNGSAACGS